MILKKAIAVSLAALFCLTALAGCKKDEENQSGGEGGKKLSLSVVTSYGGDDGNRGNYEKAYKAWEAKTGNKVADNSGTSNEEWKSKIMSDFQTGAEPDVISYFTGTDADELIKNGKVVSIEEIRKKYPDYASNMDDAKMPRSPVDDKMYAVPVNGYWELLFVNKKVLAECGVTVPDVNYTWEQFLKDCGTIKAKGKTPIAASLTEVPHYWFEYTILNNSTADTHPVVPKTSVDEAAKRWVKGFDDLKALYDKGYFPKNTLTAKDADAFQMLADGKAAFAIDGSWKLGWFVGTGSQAGNVDQIDDFTVCFVPAKGARKSTEIVGGISMGYYITKKAWDDPDKQAACVDFVKHMTTDQVVSEFGATAVTALKNGTIAPENADSMTKRVIELMKKATAIVPAAQDAFHKTSREALFADIQNIVSGKKTGEKAIADALAKNK